MIGTALAAEECTWDYDQQGADWATSGISGKCWDATCAGDRQSPIDIITSGTVEYSGDDMLEFSISYCDKIDGYFKNNGHTLQFDIDDGSGMQGGPNMTDSYITGGPLEMKYYFWQFHFHWGGSGSVNGSEHTVDGQAFPAEVHLVHVREDYAEAGTII